MMTSSLQGPATLLLPFAPVGVGLARRQLVADLRHYRLSQESIDDARVVVSELIANAIKHAQPLESGGIEASWRVDEHGILISVSDGGGVTRPAPTKASPFALGGRGLAIVESLASEWGVRTQGPVTTVYAVVPT